MLLFFLMIRRPPRSTLFPTRRSSDLTKHLVNEASLPPDVEIRAGWDACMASVKRPASKPSSSKGSRNPETRKTEDRKSTRLNSSHSQISYAVFCLKKNQ